MRRLSTSVIFLLTFFLSVPALAATVTAITTGQEGPDMETYQLILKQDGKVVKNMVLDANAGVIPEAKTFPSTYCGNPAQVVILEQGVYNGASIGDIYRYLIFNLKNWTVMDDFDGGDVKDRDTHEIILHSDGKRTEALLRVTRYQGPACRIFDLYTKPLPPSGPSFDCKTASSLAEKTVCKNPQLAALDRAYGAQIQNALRAASSQERQNIGNRYKFDMGGRDEAGMNKQEIAKVYREALGHTATAGPTATDCAKVRTPTERALCANPVLKTLDTQMAQAYHQAFKTTAPDSNARKVLIASQRAWLQIRDRCQENACLEHSYQERIQALKTRR